LASVWETLGYASILAAIATSIIGGAISVFFLVYLRDKSKSSYDEEHHRAELSEMRKAYSEQLKALTLQLTATDQRWKDVNHFLLSSQRFEGRDTKGIPDSNFLSAMGIRRDDITIDSKLVLLLTPFDPSFEESYRVVVEACRRIGLTCVRGDEEDAHGDILTHILRVMVRARFIIADVGSRNPNVYYELGLAHALDKSTILISETISDLPFDIQSKRVLIYRSLDELRKNLPEMLARALADPPPTVQTLSVARNKSAPFIPKEPGDGIGTMRAPNSYLCITNDGATIFTPNSSYIFLRLIPTSFRTPMTDVETYQIAQTGLFPMQGTRSNNWRFGRHEGGAVVFFPNRSKNNLALDASELLSTGEIWANDFYFLDPTKDRAIQLGFSFIPTAAVEEVLVNTLKNFMSVGRDKLKLSLPIEVRAGIVGVRNFRLAVPREYFPVDFEGRVIRSAIIHQDTIDSWTDDPVALLKPLFEKIYDAAGLKRPNYQPDSRRNN
jgi:hypothetical protein